MTYTRNPVMSARSRQRHPSPPLTPSCIASLRVGFGVSLGAQPQPSPHTNLDHAMGIAIRCLSRHPAPPRIHSHTELVRPARRVKRLPLERLDAGDVRQVCRRQNSHRRNQELCPRALAGFGFDDPANRRLVTEARVQNRQRDLRDLWRTDKSDCVHRRCRR